jgi:hypothetical protein
MTDPHQTKQLLPFAGEGTEGVAIEASAAVHRGGLGSTRLELHYRVTGTQALLLPEPFQPPQRRDGLWQHTCLEAFIASAEAESYWEFNLCPSGDWNAYHLEAYRNGLQPESFFTTLPFASRRDNTEHSSLLLHLSCLLPPPLAAAAALQVGLTAVLETRGGALSYWAVHHPGPEADFHHRSGWTLRL